MTAQQHFFSKVTDPNEKKRLLQDLARSKPEIQLKIPALESIHTTKAFEFTIDRLYCTLPSTLSVEDKSGNIILSFFLGGEKYFFESEYKIIASELVVNVPNNIFHLQRRNHYRVKLPMGYNAFFECSNVNGRLNKFTVPLVDLSAGGCLIQIDANNMSFTAQDEVKGHLFLPDRDPIAITGKVRHSRKDPSNKNALLSGIQFSDLTEKEKNRIGSLVMDLYREFFAKYR